MILKPDFFFLEELFFSFNQFYKQWIFCLLHWNFVQFNSVDLTAVEKHTAMVFGSVLDTLHDSGAATVARHGRTELYYRLFTARNPVSWNIFVLFLHSSFFVWRWSCVVWGWWGWARERIEWEVSFQQRPTLFFAESNINNLFTINSTNVMCTTLHLRTPWVTIAMRLTKTWPR